MNEKLICSRCEQEVNETKVHYFDGEALCNACIEEDTIICQRCGARIWRDENAGNEYTPLCQDCYDNHFCNCVNCGTLLNHDYATYDEDNGNYYCDSCYDKSHRTIHSYDYKPSPKFYGEGLRYFGVELEIDEGGEDQDNAEYLLDVANWKHDHVYCKHDGSLEDGFEIVTHPMTLSYHMNEMPWSELLNKALDMGYISHDSGTCGLHVHVNRDSFGDTVEKQDEAIARVLYFVEKHWQEILKFSRRTQSQADRWAARYERKENPKAMLDNAKKQYARYSCINLCNYSTIEFRIFRGTLLLNTLLATLQLVNTVCDAAVTLSDEQMDKLNWSRFVGMISTADTPELVEYLKKRCLYIPY